MKAEEDGDEIHGDKVDMNGLKEEKHIVNENSEWERKGGGISEWLEIKETERMEGCGVKEKTD